MRTAKVGVVVVVHAAYSKYLAHCLRSLSQQTIDNYRIRVVINGESLECVEIANKYGCVPRVVDERALGAAANEGVGDCWDCDYIVRVDSDDWIAPELLELERNYLQDRPEVDCVWCDTAESHLLQAGENHQTYMVRPVQQVDLHLACGAMYRRGCWQQIGGYSDMSEGEHIDWWQRFHAAGFRSQRIPLAGYYYRQHNENMHNGEKAKKVRGDTS